MEHLSDFEACLAVTQSLQAANKRIEELERERDEARAMAEKLAKTIQECEALLSGEEYA